MKKNHDETSKRKKNFFSIQIYKIIFRFTTIQKTQNADPRAVELEKSFIIVHKPLRMEKNFYLGNDGSKFFCVWGEAGGTN